MKRVYWRPRKAPKLLLFFVGLVAVTGALLAESSFDYPNDSTDHEMKLAAARLAHRAFLEIREERLRRGHAFVRHLDPGRSGMIGEAMSLTTSLPADLRSKQTSVNPNFAAAVVDMLQRAGVKSGDRVAIGYTGSFPAFNTCVCAAVETMNLQPTIIHSTFSSQYGANHPDYLWLDMEGTLHRRGLISFRSNAATLGGYGDRAVGTTAAARSLLESAIARNGVQPLHVDRLAQSVDARMDFYRQACKGSPIKAYINVGGGAASIRGSKGKEVFQAGVNDNLDGENLPDCVASRFAAQGVPVIHLGDAIDLARQYNLPVAPQDVPHVDASTVVRQREPNRVLAGVTLLLILVLLQVCIWSDRWERVKAYARAYTSPWRSAAGNAHVLQSFGAELSV